MSDIVEQLRIAVAIPICKPAADEIESLRQQLSDAQREAAHWKNNHETEVRRARILKERTDMPIERVQAYERWCLDLAENAELRQQLAEKDAEIERLYKAIDDNWISHQQLSSSQAREQQLREALHYSLGAWHYDGVSDEHGSIFQEANNRCDQPADTTALEAMIAKAGEVMRERCAKACTDRSAETDADNFDEWDQCNYSCAEAIRALPGVTLEDLK